MLLSNQKKNRYLTFFFGNLIVLLVLLIACLFLLKYISHLQTQSAENRFSSYVLASSLRQSSDDLTKMIRLYVATGNKRYRDQFNEILAIRNGEQARPICYDGVYWDLVVDNSKRPCPDGEKKSLIQLMIEHGFTLSEFELLDRSLSLSNQLVSMETKAMNAMDGHYENSSGQYTIQGKPNPESAKNLVFGDEYMSMKAKIMEPIQEFLDHINTRTLNTFEKYKKALNTIIFAALLLSILITSLMVYSIKQALKTLSEATKESEMLLLNILPEAIADRLKSGEKTIADEYSQASVLFADIVDFTATTYKIGATKMVKILNLLFNSFDDLTEKLGVEKVKTIGDSYMAVSGVPIPTHDHALRMADFALAIREKMQEFNEANGTTLHIRIGMTYGTVIAGVIGHKKFIYDIWGDVVNTASRMESTSLPGEIQISEKMAFMLEEKYEVVERQEMEIKGKNLMKTYFLQGKKEYGAKASEN